MPTKTDKLIKQSVYKTILVNSSSRFSQEIPQSISVHFIYPKWKPRCLESHSEISGILWPQGQRYFGYWDYKSYEKASLWCTWLNRRSWAYAKICHPREMVENSIDLLRAARTRLASCEYSIVNLNKQFSILKNNENDNFQEETREWERRG